MADDALGGEDWGDVFRERNLRPIIFEVNQATSTACLRFRNRFVGQEFFERNLQIFLGWVRFDCAFAELIVDGAVIENAPVLRADRNRFAGALDAEQACHSLSVVLQDWQRITAERLRFFGNARPVVLRICIDHPERHAAIQIPLL